MATIVINTFDNEEDAKALFATTIESEELNGAYIVAPGKVFLDDGAVPIVATKKWIVITSGAQILTE
jgi:hypothetical protein